MSKKKRLTLFSVTLPWNNNNPEEGDYADWVWTVDQDAAIRAVATQMAQQAYEGGGYTRKERAQLIESLIAGAGTYAAEPVLDRVNADIERLLAGPSGEASREAAAARTVILHLLNTFAQPAT